MGEADHLAAQQMVLRFVVIQCCMVAMIDVFLEEMGLLSLHDDMVLLCPLLEIRETKPIELVDTAASQDHSACRSSLSLHHLHS